jgi:hypothetical protein
MKWMDLHQCRLFKFALGDHSFDIFDVLLEQEAEEQFQIEECSWYSEDPRATRCDGATSPVFLEDLKDDSGWLNDAEFKNKYCMTCYSFWLIVDLIKDHRISQSRKRLQAPVDHQLVRR